ncbi:MAG: LytTR family DNA-binding domain-containing protein [Bacteroidota bacterium]
MPALRTIIVENEPLTRQTIRMMLERRHAEQVEIVGEAESVETAIHEIRNLNPQLVFMDIQLEPGTGFDILKAFPKPDFGVIFLTAYNHFAVRAFRHAAVDYLMKPVDPDQLEEAIDRAEKRLTTGQMSTGLQSMMQHFIQEEKISIRTAEKIHFVRVRDIIRLKADRDYTTIVIDGATAILTSYPIGKWEKEFQAFDFLRCYTSHIINPHHIVELKRRDGGYLAMADGTEVPISRRRKQEVEQRLFRKE